MSNMGKTSPALLRSPQGCQERYYSSFDEYDRIKKRLAKNRAQITEGIDVVNMYPAISALENGVCVYYRASSYVISSVFADRPLVPLVEERMWRKASNITFDREYVRIGDSISVRIELIDEHLSNVRIFVENSDEEKIRDLESAPVLGSGISTYTWKASEQGAFRVRLTGIGGMQKRTFVSSGTVDVLDSTYVVGRVVDNGRESELHTLDEIASRPFSNDAGYLDGKKKVLLEALLHTPQLSCVILKDSPAGPGGTVRLLNLNRRLYDTILFKDGSSRILAISPEDLQRLRDHGITIDRIVTSDSLQLVMDGDHFRWAHHGPEHVELDEIDFALYKGAGRIAASEADIVSVIQEGDPVLHVRPALSKYLYLTTMLTLKGYLFRIGSNADTVRIIVHPTTFRQRYTWIVFDGTADELSDQDLYAAFESQNAGELWIVAPLLTSAAMMSQSGWFEAYVDVPPAITGDTAKIRTLFEGSMYLDAPADASHPFKGADRSGSARSIALSVVDMQEVKGDSLGQFFPGTKGQRDEAYFVRDPSEVVPFLASEVRLIHPPRNPLYLPEDIRAYAKRTYYRNYPGLLQQCGRLFRLRLKPDIKPSPGLYMLMVSGNQDNRIHPVKVFEDDVKEIRFCHFTDLHLAARYDEVERSLKTQERSAFVNPTTVVRRVAPAINKADFIVVTGDAIDFVNEHRPWESGFIPDRNWRYFESVLKECFTVPVFVCPGNHDYRINPFPPNIYANDLNASKDALSRYPYDREVNYGGWLRNDCNGDLFFADDNGLQYFYYNMCPFLHFGFSLGNLDFVFVDSQRDQVVFLNDYATKELSMGLGYLLALFGTNPPPRSTGLTDAAIAFVEDFVSKNGVLFMHSMVFNPPIGFPDPLVHERALLLLERWNRPNIPDPGADHDEIQAILREIDKEILHMQLEQMRDEYTAPSSNPDIEKLVREPRLVRIAAFYRLFADPKQQFDEACITRNKDKIIRLLSTPTKAGGSIRLMVTGHVHKNIELKYKNTPKGYRWFMGEYSRREPVGAQEPLEECTYAIATISGSVVGYQWEPKWSGAEEHPSPDAYVRNYKGVGYRMIRLSSAGKLISMDITQIDKKDL